MPQEGEVKTWLETKDKEPIVFQGICTIGRAESNNIIISKGAVSRHHAIIHERDGEYWIVDLGGLNGTLLNGDRVIQSARLKSGDFIKIPLMDFVFRQETVSAHDPAPAQSQAVSLKVEVTPKPEPSVPSAITIPLPLPVKPTQQDELPFGLPPELLDQANKSQKPKVYVGPVDSQEVPQPLPAKPARPSALKLPEAVAAGVSPVTPLPKPSDDLLKTTTPLSLSPLIEKPREMVHINAPDIIVPEPEKPKVSTPARAVEAESFLQPTSSQEAVSSTKSVKLLQKSKEPAPTSSTDAAPQGTKPSPLLLKDSPQIAATNASAEPDTDSFILAPSGTKEPASIPAIDHPPTSAKPDKPDDSAPVLPVPDLLVSSEPEQPKKAVKKTATPTRKEIPATPEIIPSDDSLAIVLSAQPEAPCPSAKQSMYIGLASIFLPFVGLLIAPIAIILGHSALNKINQSRGALTGRQSATLGLYFGYISLSLISGYSILIYFLFFAPSQSKAPALSSGPPPLLVLTTPSLAPTPPTPNPAPTPVAPVHAPSTATPASNPSPPSNLATQVPPTDTPAPQPHVTPDLQVSTPPPPVPPAPEVTKSSPPEVTPPPMPPVALPTPAPAPDEAANANVSAAPPQNNPPSPVDSGAAVSAATATAASPDPVAPATPPVVYDPILLLKLKDGMLLQPMPEDTSSRAYMDDDTFNNCARILARPPEAKYAESVGDFLDDIKKHNPDPVRLQILSTMYENYMAGIKRDL